MSNIIDQHIVKTRKPHRCFGCLEMMPTGSSVERCTIVDGDQIYANYLCEDCVEFSKTLPSDYWADDGFYYEGDLAIAKVEEGWNQEVKTE